jgi:multiple sugar transport system permease protein
MVVAVTLEYWLGLGIALLLDRELRGMRILTSLIVLPCMVTPVVVGILWKFMLASELGVVSEVLASIGLPKQAWLASPGTSLLAIALIDVWQWTPFMFLIMLAGLKTLPREPFEAARIDGASHWQIFRQVTLPLLRNATIVALLFRIMDSFKIFDTIWGLTRGGPGSATTTISVEIYVEAFRSFRFGYSAALSLLALIVVTLSVFSVLRFTYARLEE